MEKTTEENKKKCNFLKKEVIIPLVIGLVIGLVVMYLIATFILNDKTVATIKGGSVKESAIYDEMIKYNAISLVLDNADKILLNKKYQLTDKMLEEVNQTVEEYIAEAVYYGYTEEEFLEGNYFDTKEEFVEMIKLEKLREMAFLDYVETLLPENSVNNYYETEVYGDIDSKHILVRTSEEVSEEEALKQAKEIIKKLDDGKSFDEVVEEYGDKIVYEELGYTGYASAIETPYKEALRELELETYTKEPVKTSYGYHVIYKIAQEEKPTLEQARYDILLNLAEKYSVSDTNTYNYALIKLREENGFKVKDSILKEQYDKFCESYTEPTIKVEEAE